MADLLELSELKAHLGYQKADLDDLLQQLLDAAEDQLEAETGQTFLPAATVTDEILSGTGARHLYLTRPATSVTTIKVSTFGTFATPDYTIPVTEVLIDPRNKRRVVRMQSGKFPRGELNMAVTYEAAINLPGLAVEAVKERTEMWYRRRGREHVQSESLGELGSQTLFSGYERGPRWDAAVGALRTSVAA